MPHVDIWLPLYDLLYSPKSFVQTKLSPRLWYLQTSGLMLHCKKYLPTTIPSLETMWQKRGLSFFPKIWPWTMANDSQEIQAAEAKDSENKKNKLKFYSQNHSVAKKTAPYLVTLSCQNQGNKFLWCYQHLFQSQNFIQWFAPLKHNLRVPPFLL